MNGRLRVVLVLVGLLFSAGVYPLIVFLRQEPAFSMMMSIYVTLGLFLLLASRNPSANHRTFRQVFSSLRGTVRDPGS